MEHIFPLILHLQYYIMHPHFKNTKAKDCKHNNNEDIKLFEGLKGQQGGNPIDGDKVFEAIKEHEILRYRESLRGIKGHEITEGVKSSEAMKGDVQSKQEQIVRTEETVDKYLEMGNRLQKEGSYYQAIEMYKKNLRTNLMVTSVNKIGNCYFFLELYKEACKWYKRGLSLDRKNKHAYNGLGNVYDMLGDPQKALKHFEEAIKIDKKFCYPYNNLGNFYFKKAEYVAAMKWYEEGVKASPSNCQIKLNLARCFMHLRKYNLAFYELQKVYQILKEKPTDCEEKFGWIVEQYKDKIRNETKPQINRLKIEFSKKPFLGETRATDEIDIEKALIHFLELKTNLEPN